MLLHARARLTSRPEGAPAYIDGDLRDTDKILAEAAGVLDFDQPVAIMLLGVLHCIPDEDDPAALVRRLLAAAPTGSYLVIAHRSYRSSRILSCVGGCPERSWAAWLPAVVR